MNIWLKNLWSHLVPATKSDHNKIVTLLKEINMKVSELPAAFAALKTQVGAIGDQLTKAQGEITTEIANLKTALADVELPAEATTALTDLTTAVGTLSPVAQALDDLNPDAPATPPTP